MVIKVFGVDVMLLPPGSDGSPGTWEVWKPISPGADLDSLVDQYFVGSVPSDKPGRALWLALQATEEGRQVTQWRAG